MLFSYYNIFRFVNDQILGTGQFSYDIRDATSFLPWDRNCFNESSLQLFFHVKTLFLQSRLFILIILPKNSILLFLTVWWLHSSTGSWIKTYNPIALF